MVGQLEREDTAPILSTARFAHVAVTSSTGPHVTLTAYAVSGGRFWLIAARGTVKVRAIRRHPAVSVLVREGQRSVVIAGRARVVSAWGVDDLANLIADPLRAGAAAAAFGLRNLRLLLRSAPDFVSSRKLPVDRVLVEVTPTRGMVIDGDQVTRRWGRWASGQAAPRRRPSAPAAPPDLGGVPRRAARALLSVDDCALGWGCSWGPLVLPGIATDDGAEARLPAEAMRLAGAPNEAPACLTFHRSGSRAGDFSGIIVRGQGVLTGRDGKAVRVAIAANRVSWWDGLETGTVRQEAH